MLTIKERRRLVSIFKVMDQDNDGYVTKQDIVEAYQSFFGKVPNIEVINSLFDYCDLDGSGTIELSEFVIGAIDERSVFTQERLATAFKYFDKDGSGEISASEIAECLAGQVDTFTDETARKMMKQVECNGEMSFYDFCRTIRRT